MGNFHLRCFFCMFLCVCMHVHNFLEYWGMRGDRWARGVGDLFALKTGFISDISLLILPFLTMCIKCFRIKPNCVFFLSHHWQRRAYCVITDHQNRVRIQSKNWLCPTWVCSVLIFIIDFFFFCIYLVPTLCVYDWARVSTS